MNFDYDVVPEINAYERVTAQFGGVGGILGEVDRRFLSDIDNIRISVKNAYLTYRDHLKLGENTVNDVYFILQRLKKIKNINGYAILLAKYVVGNTNEISKSRFRQVQKAISAEKNNYYLTDADVIRYCRFLIKQT